MMKTKIGKLLLVFLGIGLFFGSIAYLTITVNAQNQYTSDIAERLVDRGVPLKHVNTSDRFPYKIEIALQSSSEDDRLSIEDNWYMQLARREATLAYRVGTGLTEYTLTVYNTQGDLIYSTQTFLYPEDLSQQSFETEQINISNSKTRELVTDQLRFGNLSLDRIDVLSENIDGFNGQILLIETSAKDLDVANQSLPMFLGSLFETLDTINTKSGTNIVLCHLRLSDSQGTILLDYVRDIESGTTQWTSAEGLYNNWHSEPKLDEPEKPKPTTTEAIPYPAPSEIKAPQEKLETPYP